MKESVSFGVYVVRDSHDKLWIGLAQSHDTILYVRGVSDVDGNALETERKAYLIPDWCIGNDLRCFVTKRTIEVEFPE